MNQQKSIRVLIVDDEYPVRLSLQEYLAARGLQVSSAESGEETLSLLKENDFDCAIIDMRLPGMTGDDLILNAHKLQPDLKFLIHTGSIDYEVPKPLAAIGITVKNVIHKPVPDMKLFYEAINAVAED